MFHYVRCFLCFDKGTDFIKGTKALYVEADLLIYLTC